MEKVFREIKQEITFFSTRSLDFPSHIHEDVEMVYVRKGGGVAYCDGKRYELTEGTFFIAFPNQVHRYVSATTGEYVLLIVNPTSLLGGCEFFLKGHPAEAARYINDVHLKTLLEMALSEYEADGDSRIITAYITALLYKLVSFYEIQKERVSGDTVLQIMQYCASHYKGDITLDDVASALHISKSTVSHIFGSRLGVSFCDHINALRLNDAASLLKNHNYSITEIAHIAGFPTIRTFNRVFRDQYGISPTEYRAGVSPK